MTAQADGPASCDDSVATFRQSWLWPFLLLSILPTAWLFVAIASGYVLEADNAKSRSERTTYLAKIRRFSVCHQLLATK